jgi:hypothetical protein
METNTNTIAVTGIPSSWFSHPEMMSVTRKHFEHYGAIVFFVPLPSFRRVLIVYREIHSAEVAKQRCDPCIFDDPQDR